MYEGEVIDALTLEKAKSYMRARAGFDYLTEKFPGWYLQVPIDDIHPGSPMHCAMAWAGKPFDLNFHGMVDKLRSEHPGEITDQWLYDHGFVDGSWVKEPDAEISSGYHFLSDNWRDIVNFEQVVHGPDT